MSGQPYKKRHTIKYTEVVYYDSDGAEVARDRIHDDHTYDIDAPEPLTQQEIDDWIPSKEDDDG